jgi:hypothetical protein
MGWANGELEIKVNGERVYSYKEEHPLLGDTALLQRIKERLKD